MSLLSVIIPIYNGEKYLEETINMVLASEYQDIEIIAVNDGSTDSSADIVKKLQERDSRILLFNKDNGGVVSSRNYGVEKCNGTYICFVDQDDFVKPFMYSRLLSKMEQEDCDMAMCSSGRSVNGDETGFDYYEDCVYVGEEIRKNLLFPILFNGFDIPLECANVDHYSHIWTCVFRKTFWDGIGLRFRAYINFEDDLLVKVEALSKADKVCTISDIGYLWRVNLHSETYAHHFVENIGSKQDKEFEDLVASMMAFNPPESTVELFKQVRYCRQFVDAVHNLTSPEIKADSAFIRDYFEDNIFNRDFDATIVGRKYLKRGRVKPSILLPLLARHKSVSCYRAELLLDSLLLVTLRSKALTKLERRIKRH